MHKTYVLSHQKFCTKHLVVLCMQIHICLKSPSSQVQQVSR